MKELEGELGYIGENSEEYITFSVPITKDVKRIWAKSHALKMKIYWWERFMVSSLSNLVDQVSERI